MKVGAEVALTERGKRSEYAKILKEEISSRQVPGWLDLNREGLKGGWRPHRGPGTSRRYFNPNAIVEYYSR